MFFVFFFNLAFKVEGVYLTEKATEDHLTQKSNNSRSWISLTGISLGISLTFVSPMLTTRRVSRTVCLPD